MLPTVVKNLLIINGLLFLATISLSTLGINLIDILGLHYFASTKFMPHQLVTYMFMHGGFAHIFFNMFAVWMFGSSIENYWGPKRFLIYYLLTGFGAAALHYLIFYFEINPDLQLMNAFLENPSYGSLETLLRHFQITFEPGVSIEWHNAFNTFRDATIVLDRDPTNTEALNTAVQFISDYKEYYLNLPVIVGASGSLFGILLAFGMMFPNTRLYMIFIPIPIKAKYFVIGYGALELYSALENNPGDNVAHFAHLGCMIFGFILIKFWKARGTI